MATVWIGQVQRECYGLLATKSVVAGFLDLGLTMAPLLCPLPIFKFPMFYEFR